MRPIPNYPIWLSACMLLGPLFMISGAWIGTLPLIWVFEIVGALMVVLAMFYLSKRLHEQMEELASQRELINTGDKVEQSSENS